MVNYGAVKWDLLQRHLSSLSIINCHDTSCLYVTTFMSCCDKLYFEVKIILTKLN